MFRYNPSAESEWENYIQHGFNIVNGMGYLYATQETKTLSFSGTFNQSDTTRVTLQQGFNLVGNPFPRAAYINKSYYKLNSTGSIIEAEPVSTATFISPCNGVIVQGTADEIVTFTTTAPGAVGAAPNNGSLQIALAQANTRSNALLDNAIVSFNEGSELGKFYFGRQNANIYIPQNGHDYAIAFSKGQGEMPLNFKATENGEYSLTVNPENVEMSYLHLIDNLTGADVDLLVSPTYTFTARTTEYASRFRLVFSANGVNENSASTESAAFAFISGDNIIVNGEGTLQIVDVMGRMIRSTDVVRNVSTAGIPAGVYVLRLIDGNNVRTQKIVIE